MSVDEESRYLVWREFLGILRPRPRLTVSGWADQFRYLSQESSSEPGKWSTARVPYLKEIMDSATDPEIETIVFMASSQVGKTSVLENIVGYFIDQEPCPILLVSTTLDKAAEFSKERATPMFRDTPCLREKVHDERSRKKDNTTFSKSFPGGHVAFVGANSPASLSSRPIRLLLMDEIDRIQFDTKEGDPVKLAMKRTQTFHNRKIILASSPSSVGFSKIESAYEGSDKRKYFVPCPHCTHFQILRFDRVKWEEKNPKTARYHCEACDKFIHDQDRMEMVAHGEWRRTGERNKVAGFWINELYSPWGGFQKVAASFLEAKRTNSLREFVNTSLGESWQEETFELSTDKLFARREEYPAEIPKGGLVILAGCDVQRDRIEGEIVAFGKDRESWGIEYFVLYGDPSRDEIWKELDLRLRKEYVHERGVRLGISATCIDSGDGHFTDRIYAFVKPRQIKKVYAVKGSSKALRQLIQRPKRKNDAGIAVFQIGTEIAKEEIYADLQVSDPGPGYCHFPIQYGLDYFDMLTAEKVIEKKDQSGRMVRKWVRFRRNEALDCRVYVRAALAILNPDLKRLAEEGPRAVRNEKKYKIRRISEGLES